MFLSTTYLPPLANHMPVLGVALWITAAVLFVGFLVFLEKRARGKPGSQQK